MNFIKKTKIILLIIPIIVLLFNLLMVLNPKEMGEASKNGLMLWFNSVLPSLLPFIITTNLLSGLKVINIFGVLFEPFMIPLFGINGNGSFPFAVGLSSGYPLGAKVVCDLRSENLITKTEGQRLLSFVNNSGPLFILGAVASSLLNSIKAGYFILFIHFASAIINGMIFKYYGRSEDNARSLRNKKTSLKEALNSIEQALKEKGFSSILSESLMNSITTVLNIGGFIILFSVIVKALEITNIINVFEKIFSPFLNIFHITPDIFKGLFYGFFEVTGGIQAVSHLPLTKPVILLCAFLISFAGLSIHAQSASFISKTDMKISIYILSKLSHGIITVILGYIAFPFFSFENETAVFYTYTQNPVKNLKASLIVSGITIAVFMFTVLITFIFNRLFSEKKPLRYKGRTLK